MNYTLYIDESGDFRNPDIPWIVGGLIIATPFKKSEELLSNLITPLMEQYNLTKKDFHLTDIRQKQGDDKSRQIASDVFTILDTANTPSCLVTTVNKANISGQTVERTYRLMLLDLIIQAETAIHQAFDTEITHLDLVIATRTINGVRQTSDLNVNQEILQALSKSIESDLVASGQIALLNNIKTHFRDAKYQWGLICADFICNTTYRERLPEYSQILTELKDKKQLFSFETFSSPELRRVLNHERNQNYINALFDSLKLVDYYPKNNDYKSVLLRLIKTIFTQTGTSGAKIYFDGLLERIWRSQSIYAKYIDKSKVLLKFFDNLQEVNEKINIHNFQFYQFKINNLVLLCLNHEGDTSQASNIIQNQYTIINSLVSDPSNFSVILDFYSREVELYVNSLDFKKAESLANNHWQMIEEYQSIWELISCNMDISDFLSSKIAIRAKTNLIRCMVLNYNPDRVEVIKKKIDEISPCVSHYSDKSRIFCQSLLFLSKENQLDDAIKKAIEYIGGNSKVQEFDYFFFLFVVNQKLLISDKASQKKLISKVSDIVDHIISEEFSKPYQNMLRYRELSLFYHFQGLKKESYDNIKKAQNLELNTSSKISTFLTLVNEVQIDFINHDVKNLELYSERYSELSSLLQSFHVTNNDNLLYKLRYYLAS